MPLFEEITYNKYAYFVEMAVIVNLLTQLPATKENIQAAQKRLAGLEAIYDKIYPSTL